MRRLGHCYKSQGKHEEAAQFFVKALKIQKTSGGENLSAQASSLMEMIPCYLAQKKFEAAIQPFQERLSIQKTQSGNPSKEEAEILSFIGHCYKEQKKQESAQNYHKQAYECASVCLGKDHPKTQEYKTRLSLGDDLQ